MDNKRVIIAIVITAGFLLLWNHFVTGPQLEKQRQLEAQQQAAMAAASAERGDELEAVRPEDPLGGADTAGSGETVPGDPAAFDGETADPAAAQIVEAIGAEMPETVVVETDFYRVELINSGAKIKSWVLKEFEGADGQPLELVSSAGAGLGHLPLEIHYSDDETSGELNSALYQVQRGVSVSDLVERYSGETATALAMEYADGKGLHVRKEFLFYERSYRAEFKCTVIDRGIEQPYDILLGPGFGNPSAEEAKSRYFFSGRAILGTMPIGGGMKLERVAPNDTVKSGKESGYLVGFIRKRVPFLRQGASLRIEERVRWAGLADNYFLFALWPAADPGPIHLTPFQVEAPVESDEKKKAAVQQTYLMVSTRIDPADPRCDLYVGPKQMSAVEQAGLPLGEIIDFGFFGFIAKPLLWLLNFIHSGVGNYGFAIIILTVIIKILFLPLTHKQFSSMKKMQKVQPEMKKIQEKYKKLKGDMKARQKMNAEVMALYKEKGVNPLGGCFPILLQLPVLYAFYSFLPVAIELRKAPFIFWITDLSLKDPLYVTPLVMGVSMFIQQKMTPMTSVDPTQRRMFTMMPLLFTFFFLNLPSGLVLYWLVNNVLSIFQQTFINKRRDPEPHTAKSIKGKKNKGDTAAGPDEPSTEGKNQSRVAGKQAAPPVKGKKKQGAKARKKK